MSKVAEIQKAPVWEFVEAGCDPGLQAAVQIFASRWQGLRTRYKVQKMLTELIFPPWQKYLESLPEPLRRLRKLIEPDNLTDPGATVITIVRTARAICRLERIDQPTDFEPTIGTLRSVLEWCRIAETLKTPDNRERLRTIRGLETGTCNWRDDTTGQTCQEITEYVAYLRGADVGIGLETGLFKRLHQTRCVLHAGRTDNQAKLKSLAQIMKLQDKSSTVDEDCGPGHGLCRMCGRLTERDASHDFYHSRVGVVITKTSSLSDRFCAEHVPGGKRYHAALIGLENYDDTRARLQKQSFHNADLKELHSNPAVNWFENRLVRQLEIFSIQESDPRKLAGDEAMWATSELLPETRTVFNSEIEIALKLLSKRLMKHQELFHRKDKPNAIWQVLGKLYSSDRPSFDRIAILMLYSLGHDQKKIALMLRLQTRVVVTHVRQIAPAILPNSDEVNLGMAADYLVRRKKITLTQIEIIYWKSQNERKNAVIKRLRMSRQGVWKALKDVPNNLRFDTFPSETVE